MRRTVLSRGYRGVRSSIRMDRRFTYAASLGAVGSPSYARPVHKMSPTHGTRDEATAHVIAVQSSSHACPPRTRLHVLCCGRLVERRGMTHGALTCTGRLLPLTPCCRRRGCRCPGRHLGTCPQDIACTVTGPEARQQIRSHSRCTYRPPKR